MPLFITYSADHNEILHRSHIRHWHESVAQLPRAFREQLGTKPVAKHNVILEDNSVPMETTLVPIKDYFVDSGQWGPQSHAKVFHFTNDSLTAN